MQNLNKKVILIFLTVFLLGEIFFALSFGSVKLNEGQIYQSLWQGACSPLPVTAPHQGAVHDIVWLLRLPRLILAAATGAGLAVCGVVMQAIVKNPLADPYILGISSGAYLGAVAAILLGVGSAFGANSIGICAFIGAFLLSVLVLFIAGIGSQMNTIKLLLAGMALNTACSAVSSFIVYFAANHEGIQTVIFWLMGSFAGANWQELVFIVPIILGGVLYFWSQSRVLDMMLLGDQTATTLGINLLNYRKAYLLLSSLMIGFLVYAAGMIGFVGLIIPHIVRLLSGVSHKYLVPLSALTGAVLLVFADVLCRILVARTEIPIGIIVALVGAPAFIYLVFKRTYAFGGNE